MPDLAQHVVVTLMALAAAWIVVRRVFGVFGPARSPSSGCPSCASGGNGCGHAAANSSRDASPPGATRSQGPSRVAPAPLTFHRKPR